MGICAQAQVDNPSVVQGSERGSKVHSRNPVTPGQLESRKINLRHFHIDKVLGRGSFGKVMLVTKKDTGQVYAMKVLKKEAVAKRKQVQHTINEREIMEQSSGHPFIVKLRYAFQTADKLYFVMDFWAGGELFFHLRQETMFSEERAAFYAAEILLALQFIHKKEVVYRDLKPENVLLNANGHVQITDFGLSATGVDQAKKEKAWSFCGTPEYLAPEIIKGVGHDQAVDYWSLGVVLYEMLSGKPPFYSKNREKMFRNLISRPVPMASHFSTAACDILTRLLKIDPAHRLCDPETVKAHPFFASIDWVLLFRVEVEPPWKPNVEEASDVKNFDAIFTEDEPADSQVDSNLSLKAKLKNNYAGFTYAENAFGETPASNALSFGDSRN